MRRLISPFSAWVLPFRLAGAVVFLYAFLRMLVAPEVTMLGMAIMGALLWQAGTAIEDHSSLFRRLQRAPIRDLARTRSIKAPSWTSVASFRREHPFVGADTFIITTRDGYDAGVVAPEELYSSSPNDAAHVTLGELAKTISYADAVRFDDPILEAFWGFRSKSPSILSVLDSRDVFHGVVTRSDVDHWLNNGPSRRVHDAVPTGESTSNRKLAA